LFATLTTVLASDTDGMLAFLGESGCHRHPSDDCPCFCIQGQNHGTHLSQKVFIIMSVGDQVDAGTDASAARCPGRGGGERSTLLRRLAAESLAIGFDGSIRSACPAACPKFQGRQRDVSPAASPRWGVL